VSAGAFFYGAGNVQSKQAIAFLGTFEAIGDDAIFEGINTDGQAKQVIRITVPGTVDNSTVYSVSYGGQTASVTTDASATQAELGALLLAEIPTVGSFGAFDVAYAGGNLDLTARRHNTTYPVAGFTVNSADTTNDLGTPAEQTSASAATPIEFGRALITTGIDASGREAFKVPVAADFSAQVITETYASLAATDSLSSTISFRGQVFTVDTPFDTNQATTLANHAANLETLYNASFGAGTGIVAAVATNDITHTLENPGEEFDVATTVNGSGGGTVAKVYTTGAPDDPTSSLRAKLRGMSKRRHDIEDQNLGNDDPAYGSGRMVEGGARGFGWVSSAQSPTAHSNVWVSLATATKGQFYNDVGTDYVWLPKSIMEWTGRVDSANSIAQLRIKGL